MDIKKTVFVRDLKIGDQIETLFAVKEKRMCSYSTPNRSGEQFMRVVMVDVSGMINGVIWNEAQEISKTFDKDDIVLIKGEITDYKGPQIVIESLKKVDRNNVDLAYFQLSTKKNRREMFNKVKEYANNYINNPFLYRLLQDFFDDHEFCKLFIQSPGGRLIHHNYVGGLLEHSVEVVEICLRLIELYPGIIYPDLLISGAILHDIGKIKEYDLNSVSFQMTDRGRLIGHITLGRDMVMESASKQKYFPEELLLELEHVILSHHGKKEWGSPEIPKTINAFALFHADLLSARLNQFSNIFEQSLAKDMKWSEWDRYLERNIYLPDYLRDDN
ncbi:MAG: metal-dependent phosphohydrolase [Firmicutes bacterium HGW-Firmicutes-13]|nr:MAG: metal-dependent phosphohydrolase [Firmicutes bacterium HGW-Firmicutes-13]